MGKKKITVIGASNVDITGFTKQKLIYHDANMGTVKTSPGGVGRNVAENLIRLGKDVKLVSVFGDDPLSTYIIQSCRDLGIDIEDSLFLKNANAASFLAVMDEGNDLAVGISAMDIYNEVPIDFIQSKMPLIAASECVVLETNMPEDLLQYIVSKSPESKFAMDTVSGKKALRGLSVLPHLHILKTNLLEAQMMRGEPDDSYSVDLVELVAYFLQKGVKNVFITLGKDGVIYGNSEVIEKRNPIPQRVVNTIGAGDAFFSGIIYADALGLDIHEMVRYGMACAGMNVQNELAVSPEMSVENIEKILKKC